MDPSTGHCENCLIGAIDGKGKLEQFAGVLTFIARPDTKPIGALIISTDIFGPQLKQAQENAVSIAKGAGILVVVPDQFDGDALQAEGFDRSKFGEWLAKHPQISKLPKLEAVINELKEKEGIKKIGIIGYCYGAKSAVVLAGTDKINAYAIAHPSRLELPKDMDEVKHNGLFLCAQVDNSFTDEQRTQSEDILKKRKDIKSIFKVYPGTEHGFAVRPKEHETKQRIEALEETINFFKNELN